MRSALQPERSLMFHVDVFDRMHPVPERQSAGDNQSDQHTDSKKETITGKGDEQDGDDS